MYYLIDGYNLLFSSNDLIEDLQKSRNHLLDYLQVRFDQLGLNGMIAFDGKTDESLFGILNTNRSLQVSYTSSEVSADEYILEFISLSNSGVVVVTNDVFLGRQCRAKGASVLSIKKFLKKLNQTKKMKAISRPSSPKHIEFFVRLFEEKLSSELFPRD